MHIATFSIMNKSCLDIHTNTPPPQHLSSTVMISLTNCIEKHGPHPLHHWSLGTFGPMLQAFHTTTHHSCQKPWCTTHANTQYHCPNPNLLYKWASQPPCSLGICLSAGLRWSQSASPTRQTFFGNSYTAPTPSLFTLQLLGLSISKAFSLLLWNATHMFQLPPTTPAFDLYSFLTLEDT